MVTAASMTPASSAPASGARLFTRDGQTLPLTNSHLAVEARGGIARTILTQRFVNDHAEPLTVTYLLPLPADGAVSGFSFTLQGERIVGEIDLKARARERFEQAIIQGHSAALLEQDRSSVFTQKVGNIPPHSEVVCEVVVDQRLAWVVEGGHAAGQWEWRFPTVVGPRYMGEPGRVKDANKITVDVADGPVNTVLALDLEIGDAVVYDREPSSPSHPVRTDRAGLGRTVVLDDQQAMRLDRDVIVRWPVAKAEVGISLVAARPSDDAHSGRQYGLLTIVPPEAPQDMKAVPRDLILLIDTSGSMGGRPLDQAKRLLCAMVDTLGASDRLEMIEFSSRPNRWKREPVVASRDGKRAAISWLSKLTASGGTEMKTGLLEAITPLREGAQRQVVLVTDGYIGFEAEIVKTVLERLPRSCRLHTVGVGSSPNRSLLTPVARAGGGVELTLALDEDVERGAARIIAKTAQPLVTAVKISGDAIERVVPGVVPDLYAGCPALVCVELSALGGSIVVEGVTGEGTISQRVAAPTLALGEGHQGVTALFGREWVEDLETLRCAGGDVGDVDQTVERVGLAFQLATRLTSWVAVSKSRTVDNPEAGRSETMPHEMPYGASAEGFGLRAPMASAPTIGGRGLSRRRAAPARLKEQASPAGPPPPADKDVASRLSMSAADSLSADDFDLDQEELSLASPVSLDEAFGRSSRKRSPGAEPPRSSRARDVSAPKRSSASRDAAPEEAAAELAPGATQDLDDRKKAEVPRALPQQGMATPKGAAAGGEGSAPEPAKAPAPTSSLPVLTSEAKSLAKRKRPAALIAVLVGLGLIVLAIIVWLLFGGAA